MLPNLQLVQSALFFTICQHCKEETIKRNKLPYPQLTVLVYVKKARSRARRRVYMEHVSEVSQTCEIHDKH